jgi:hypothetical protein
VAETVSGAKLQVHPAGSPEHANDTDPENPFCGATCRAGKVKIIVIVALHETVSSTELRLEMLLAASHSARSLR